MKIIDNIYIESNSTAHINFFRVEPENLSVTVLDIIKVIANYSWIGGFDDRFLQLSFLKRAQSTAEYLSDKLQEELQSGLIKDTGEYVVSELARQTIINELGYLDVPLAELFKEKVSGNPGFDFYSQNLNDIIIFGEAKYLSGANAYGRGMEQVDRFIREEQDISDIADIRDFFSQRALENVIEGKKGYAIGFSSKKTESKVIVEGIKRNPHFSNLAKNKELIFVAVNI